MAAIEVQITKEQARAFEDLDGLIVLMFVMIGCDGKLRVSDYEKNEVLLECTVV